MRESIIRFALGSLKEGGRKEEYGGRMKEGLWRNDKGRRNEVGRKKE